MADPRVGHRDHDPLLVASLLDDDLTDAERAMAQGRVDTCPGCAAVYGDLRALSVATRSQPAPARPRDFRLTMSDATRLSAEPADPVTRLTGVMTDLPATAAHRTHDTTLVASLADHSLAQTERTTAEALVASCSECAALNADLLTLVAATRAMPTPPRPIDYTLTPAHAARLRPNPWRRLVAAVGSTRDGVTRPLAIGLSTLGIVGILVTSAPGVLQGGFGSSAASSQAGGSAESITTAPGAATDTSGQPDPGAALAPEAGGDVTVSGSGAPDRAGASLAPVYGVTNAGPVPGASVGIQADGSGKGAVSGAAAEPSAAPPTSNLESTAAATIAATSTGIDAMLVISMAFLLVGLGLFVLRWSARRLTDG